MTKPTKPRRRRAAADILVDRVLALPLGQLIQFAKKLHHKDPDVARFLVDALEALPSGGDSAPPAPFPTDP